MATQHLQFSSAPSQTCTPKLFTLGGSSVLNTGSAVADSPSGSGLYKSTFSEASALNGTFRCVVFVGSVGVAGYEVVFTGTDTETAQAGEFVNVIGNTPSAIADAVWDEQTSAHQIAGSTGKALATAGQAIDYDTLAVAIVENLPTTEGIEQSIYQIVIRKSDNYDDITFNPFKILSAQIPALVAGEVFVAVFIDQRTDVEVLTLATSTVYTQNVEVKFVIADSELVGLAIHEYYRVVLKVKDNTGNEKSVTSQHLEVRK